MRYDGVISEHSVRNAHLCVACESDTCVGNLLIEPLAPPQRAGRLCGCSPDATSRDLELPARAIFRIDDILQQGMPCKQEQALYILRNNLPRNTAYPAVAFENALSNDADEQAIWSFSQLDRSAQALCLYPKRCVFIYCAVLQLPVPIVAKIQHAVTMQS
jgi:hypothetical protein